MGIPSLEFFVWITLCVVCLLFHPLVRPLINNYYCLKSRLPSDGNKQYKYNKIIWFKKNKQFFKVLRWLCFATRKSCWTISQLTDKVHTIGVYIIQNNMSWSGGIAAGGKRLTGENEKRGKEIGKICIKNGVRRLNPNCKI